MLPMCFKEKRIRRNVFEKAQLELFSEKVREQIIHVSKVDHNKSYNLLRNMADHFDKYEKLIGKNNTFKLFKSMDFSTIESLCATRRMLGKVLGPNDIQKLYNNLTKQKMKYTKLEQKWSEIIDKQIRAGEFMPGRKTFYIALNYKECINKINYINDKLYLMHDAKQKTSPYVKIELDKNKLQQTNKKATKLEMNIDF